MKRMLVILMMASIALAGCADNAPEEEEVKEDAPEVDPAPFEPVPSDPPEQASTGNPPAENEEEENEGSEQQNRPPSASLQASASDVIPGTVVTYSIGGSDPDGNPLEWTLDVGGGEGIHSGIQLPAQISHNYTTQGEYRIVLTVTDGEFSSQVIRWLDVDPLKGPNANLTAPRAWGGSTQISNPSPICIGDGVDGLAFDLLPYMSNWTYILYGAQNLPDLDPTGIYPTDGWTVTFTGGDSPGIGGTEGVVPTNSTGARVCNQSAGPNQSFMIFFFDEGWVHGTLEDPADPCYYYC